MKKISFVIITICILLIFYFLTYKHDENILYSWSMDEVKDSTDIIEIAKKFKINTIYQEFSTDYFNTNDNSYLQKMSDNNIDVLYLTGDPSYTYDNIKEKINLVVSYNKNNSYHIKGIVLDIEPYLNDNFTDYNSYVNNLVKGYKYAKKMDIYYVVVIPYWLDKKEEKLLEQLIKNCDEVSIMNYNIKNTTKNIKEEYKYVKKYKKEINTIYEVNSKKSFSSYKDIDNDFQKIKKEYHGIRKAYHYYGSMK